MALTVRIPATSWNWNAKDIADPEDLIGQAHLMNTSVIFIVFYSFLGHAILTSYVLAVYNVILGYSLLCRITRGGSPAALRGVQGSLNQALYG